MIKADKEQIQYLLTQYLEGGATEKELVLLFSIMDREQEDKEWIDVLEELISSETAITSYDPVKWEGLLQKILLATEGAEKEQAGKSGDTTPETTASSSLKMKPGVIHLPQVKKIWLAVASAAAILGLTVALWFLYEGNSQSNISTSFGQQKKINLPDQTEITLNAHSAIKFLKRWKNNQPREVWLKGEAFFKVQHTNTDTNSIKQQERFIVYTDLAKIEVLGTVFNIRQRRGKMEIVLEQGKIKVSFIKNTAPDIIMKPGQIVTLNAQSAKAVTNQVIPEDYTAWTKKKLILKDASFEEIIEYMEDNFGKHIKLSDPALADRKVEGTFKIDNLDDALFVLSKALNIDIIEKQDSLFISPR